MVKAQATGTGGRMGAAEGWDIARTAWRKHRRRVMAFGVAVAVNALVIVGFIASIHTLVLHEGRAIEVMIVPPFAFQHPKRKPPKTPPISTRTEPAHVHAATPSPAPAAKLPPAPLAPEPKPLPAPPPPAYGKWTATPGVKSQLDDQRSAARYMRAGANCAKGELWRLSREEQDKCLARLGSKVPPDDGTHHHPPPNDPGGEFAAEMERRAEKARPMKGPPTGQCPIETEGSNLHRVCHN
jgi:hypothetical protein